MKQITFDRQACLEDLYNEEVENIESLNYEEDYPSEGFEGYNPNPGPFFRLLHNYDNGWFKAGEKEVSFTCFSGIVSLGSINICAVPGQVEAGSREEIADLLEKIVEASNRRLSMSLEELSSSYAPVLFGEDNE